MLSSPHSVPFAPPLPTPNGGPSVVLRAPAAFGRSATTPRLAPVTALVFSADDPAQLQETLNSLTWCDEILVLETTAATRTLDVATAFPRVRWHVGGTAAERDRAVNLARNDWILALKPGEMVSPELAQELLVLRPELHVVYAVRQHDYLGARLIRTCGWSRGRPARFFNRNVCGFAADSPELSCGYLRVQRLRHPIRRQRAHSLDDFLVATHFEARRFARSQPGTTAVSPVRALCRAGGVFVRSYLFQRGWMQGSDGLAISAAAAQTVFWKHLFHFQAEQERASRARPATR